MRRDLLLLEWREERAEIAEARVAAEQALRQAVLSGGSVTAGKGYYDALRTLGERAWLLDHLIQLAEVLS